jgi:hypothetical protein
MGKVKGLVDLVSAATDPLQEGRLLGEVQQLRGRFLNAAAARSNSKPPTSRMAEMDRAQAAIVFALKVTSHLRDPLAGDAGHGPGHMARDYVHALRLALDDQVSVTDVVSGIIGGALHDLGTSFVDRYDDRNRALRHAEVSALVVQAAFARSGILMEPEIDQVAYGIAAHTNFLKAQTVTCRDGEERTVEPYIDTVDGSPIISVWLPRWADRLDCNGPCFVARHYLTLCRDHFDYSQDGFYQVTYAGHLQTAVPEGYPGPCTMVDHLQRFASSQTNDSPYGRHDFGVMVQLRDAYKASLEHIIQQVRQPTDVNVERIHRAWTGFLGATIEPSPTGKLAAHDLALAFNTLEPAVQNAWACGFRATMSEYLVWADRNLAFLSRLPGKFLQVPGLCTDIRELIRPKACWVDLLRE